MKNRATESSRSRREFLCTSAALASGLLLPARVHAAQIKALQGAVSVNGKPARVASAIKPGDVVTTGPGARIAFVVGEDAFLLREKTRLELQKSTTPGGALIGGLRILTGGLLAVFAKGPRQLTTPTATAGIRGTGVYIEASAERTYLCTCYGEVELRDSHGKPLRTIVSGYHTPAMVYAEKTDGRAVGEAKLMNHTDDELIMLEALVGRVSPVKERAKLQAPEEKVTSGPRSAPAQAAAQSSAPAAPPSPAAAVPAAQAASPPAVTPAPVTAPARVAPTPSEVTDWRLPPPKALPER
jgi:hypothetical protein